MKLERRIGGHKIVVSIDPRHRERAVGLLATLAELHAAGPPLAAGSTIDFGWCRLVLKPAGQLLEVHEPDFAAGTAGATRASLDNTFDVLVAQIALAAQVGAEPVAAPAEDTLVVRKGALALRRLFAKREAPSPGDTGWFVGDPDDGLAPDVVDMERITVGSLVRDRPSLLPVLALPPGYIAVLAGDDVEAILDPADQVVFRGGHS
jgi:hypothetical protein